MLDAGDRKGMLREVYGLLSSSLSQVNALAQRVAMLQRRLYGRSSEKLSEQQLALALGKVMDSAEPAAAEAEEAEAVSHALPRPVTKRNRRGRQKLPAHLPREEVRLVPTPEQMAALGDTARKVGEERSEVLEYRPAQFTAVVHVREVWSNAYGDIIKAAVAGKVIDKGLPGPGLLAHVVVSKYRDHQPLSRQTRMIGRAGVQISKNTMVDWVAAVAHLLQPLAKLIYALALNSHVLQADDTRLPVLDHSKEANIKKARLWALLGDARYLAYRYAKDWRGQTTAKILGQRRGWLQVDGYKGYEKILATEGVEGVGCWMHCRRYFVKAFESKDTRAARPLELIKEMYQVEADSRRDGDTLSQRFWRRLRDTRPHLVALKEWIAEHKDKEPPSTLLGKALTYADNHWDMLHRFLEDGALELDNGGVERAMRGPAIGRKNWLFAGSDEGGERAATIATVLETAALHGLNEWEYLRDILIKLSDGWPMKRIDELLPHRWKELHARGDAENSRDAMSSDSS